MKPWIHPQERRTRIFLAVQVVVTSLAAIGIPVLLLALQEPTRDHIILSIVMPIICIAGVFFSIIAFRKTPKKFASQPESEVDTAHKRE